MDLSPFPPPNGEVNRDRVDELIKQSGGELNTNKPAEAAEPTTGGARDLDDLSREEINDRLRNSHILSNPNQQEAIDGDEFIALVRTYEDIYYLLHGKYPDLKTTLQFLARLQVVDTGVPGKAGSNHYYVYSQKDKRWLDLRHFADTGWRVALLFNSFDRVKWGRVGGWGVEVVQKFIDLWPGIPANGSSNSGNAASSLGKEDDYSNTQGAAFVDFYLRLRLGRTARVSVLLRMYFLQKQIGSKNKSNTLSRLPVSESEWQFWHQSGFPLGVEEGARVWPKGFVPPREPGQVVFDNPTTREKLRKALKEILGSLRESIYEAMDWRNWVSGLGG